MHLDKLVVGSLQTNCYLAWDEETQESIVVDPGDDSHFIIQRILDLNLRPQLIIATHGHFDHVLGATELKLAFKIPFLLNQKDFFLYKRAAKTSKFFSGISADPIIDVDKFLKEGDIIQFGKGKLGVIETPGHTPGSITLFGEKIIFSGDVIFREGYGRTDFSYAFEGDLKKSAQKILKLSPETIIYPGHGPEFSVEEARSNILL